MRGERGAEARVGRFGTGLGVLRVCRMSPLLVLVGFERLKTHVKPDWGKVAFDHRGEQNLGWPRAGDWGKVACDHRGNRICASLEQASGTMRRKSGARSQGRTFGTAFGVLRVCRMSLPWCSWCFRG